MLRDTDTLNTSHLISHLCSRPFCLKCNSQRTLFVENILLGGLSVS